MKAVIMAGGEGSRLRPLTCTVPKPMVKILGKPVIEYIFDLLLSSGITEAAVTLGYLPHIIENEYESGYKNLKINFVREDEPLGTAGGVRNAALNYDEPFVVISGDAICDFDLKKILEYHKACGATFTVVAKQVKDPREYGIVCVDDNNRVLSFVEKPSWSQAVSNLANTGIYIMNPECLELIPKDRKFDFASDLFPLILEKGMSVFCCKIDGYWCDIGNTDSYLECQQDAMNGKIKNVSANRYLLNSSSKYTVIPPVFLGENVDISEGSVIGPYAVICDECYIGEGSKIRYSCINENCYLGSNTAVTGAVVCSGAALKKGASMFEGSVAGAGCVIGENASVSPGVSVWPGKITGDSVCVSSDVKYGNIKTCLFNGSDYYNAEMNPELLAKLGRAVSFAANKEKIGVATDGTVAAEMMKLAFVSGAVSVGAIVWDFGDSFETQLSFLVNCCSLVCGVFFSGEGGRKISFCGKDGLSLTRSFERKIIGGLNNGSFPCVSDGKMKAVSEVESLKSLYIKELMKAFGNLPINVRLNAECNNKKICSVFEECYSCLGGSFGSDIVLIFDESGRTLTAETAGVKLSYDKLLAICCSYELDNGNDVSVSFDLPEYFDFLSDKGKVLRYLRTPADESDSDARMLASKQRFSSDALFLAAKLLSIMECTGHTLAELSDSVPQKCCIKKIFDFNFAPSELIGMCKNESSFSGKTEGVRLQRENGVIRFIPDNGGEKIRALIEADTMEAANELCIDAEEILNDVSERS